MKRREFITLVGGVAVAWPVVARAQQPAKVAQIGFLDFGPASARASRVEALQGGLRDLGYVEGENIENDPHCIRRLRASRGPEEISLGCRCCSPSSPPRNWKF